MLKEGKYRAWRNIPIGWLTHSIHGRDKTEKIFHVINELIMIFIVLLLCSLFSQNSKELQHVIFIVIFCHTLMWIIDGNFHVYLLDSFQFVENAGINKVIDFVQWAGARFENSEAVSCVLVYGSFCRSMFHGRSDLDLRVVRKKTGFAATLLLLYLTVYVRVKSLFAGIPTDLQVVDSFEFLVRQMRDDEKPVVVYCVSGVKVENLGLSFDEIVRNPSIIMKKN